MRRRQNPSLRVNDLHLEFRTQEGTVNALKGASLTIDEGEIVGVVGESGSGKSVTAMSVLQLLPKDKARITKGEIVFFGSGHH